MRYCVFSVLFTVLIASVGYATPGNKIFYEDFSSYSDGEFPVGWKGGDNLCVVETNQGNILKYFVNGQYNVTTDEINFSENFKATIIIKHYYYNEYRDREDHSLGSDYSDNRKNNSINIQLGEYYICIGDGDIIAGMKGKWPSWKSHSSVFYGKRFSLSITKKNKVYYVYLNNEKVIFGRFKNKAINSIRFSSNSKFEIHSIDVEEI
ncbi:MAG: hypothetical protein D3922_11055 [Candidatus Electrothrix sp. AR1]|nr:hypothetical protein [Candidatus Electrothrix sp. AR1]